MSTVSPAGIQSMDITPPHLAAIRQVVEQYAEILRDGNVAMVERTFHPQAIMSGYFNDDLMLMPMEGFKGLVGSVEPPVRTGEPFRYEIKDVQVTGNIATVEIKEYHFLGHNFKTYFHLTNIDGRWQITAKLFTSLGPAGEG